MCTFKSGWPNNKPVLIRNVCGGFGPFLAGMSLVVENKITHWSGCDHVAMSALHCIGWGLRLASSMLFGYVVLKKTKKRRTPS
jgi:hypothetical protein